ncbi:MAK10-like protein [Tanacetum coccineum]
MGTMRRLFDLTLSDEASNWLERLPAGSISTWEDLTNRFLAQFFPSRRTSKLCNDILMFQQHQGESLSEAYEPSTKPSGGKLRDKNDKESWALLEDLVLYDNESWNDPKDFAKPAKAISVPQDVPSTSNRRLIKLQNQVQRLMKAHLAPNQPIQVNKSLLHARFVVVLTTLNIVWKISSKLLLEMHPRVPTKREIETPKPKELEESLEDEFADLHLNLPVLEVLAHVPIYDALLGDSKPFDTLADLGSCMNLIPLNLFKKLNVGLLEEAEDVLGLADGKRESYKPRTSEDDIGARPPYFAKRDFQDNHLPEEWEIARDAEINPFKDILVFRKMIEFLGTIPINLKRNMWESEEIIDNKMDWDRPPKEGDGAWHIKIELIDPDGE